ncbi:MAG: efflux RND transporter permease subunit, partial [Gammaproteobacteria bacterium]
MNIISLSGLAFDVGMVLDASIIVLENIIRLREQGEAPQQASLKGTTQIWGALLASTMTTVAIFLPIIFLKDEAGQLFADLALTITATICVSLIVALTVIPAFAAQFLSREKLKDPHRHWWQFATRQIMRLTNTPLRRISWIAVLITLPIIVALVLLPKADYLPEGNRNLVFAFILPPPGANIEQIETEIGQVIKERMEPYLTGESQPQIEHYFFVAFFRGAFLGVRATDPARAGELVAVINEIVSGFPDTIAFAKRTSLFGGFGAGRTVDMNIQGSDIGLTLKAASFAARKIPEIIPGAKIQPFPELVLAEPELRLIPDDRRIAEAGWNRGIMATVVRALGDGLFVGDYFDGEQTLDIIVRAETWDTPEELASIPLATPNAGILPVGELVNIQRTSGPVKIRRINRRRTATLRITPPENVSLEEVSNLLDKEIEPEVRRMLSEDGDVQYTGTADKLKKAIQSMQGSFLLAIIILYLLMSALFQSFKDSLLVMMSIPLATVGGVVMLNLINVLPNMLFGIQVFQPMDMLTMIGFIILLGLVVNNAILLVHQSRLAEREGLSRRLAVEQAISLRLRPILMSTLTSIFGMLPLLLVPGAGTELYRGLAGVIVGGIFVSTIFTLILLPSLLRIGEGKLVS